MIRSLSTKYLLILLLVTNTNQQKNGNSEPKKKWYEDENGRFKWSHDCNFPSGGFLAADVATIEIDQRSACPNLCYEESRCTHFIYSNGYCFMRALKFMDNPQKAALYNNPNGLCGFVVERPNVIKNWFVGYNDRVRWSTECEYPNATYNIFSESKLMMDGLTCAAHCLSIKRCTHFAWFMKTCWVKDFRGAPIVQTVDKMISLCGFIPERLRVVNERARTTVSSKVKEWF